MNILKWKAGLGVLWLTLASAAWAGYDEGVAALQADDYPRAMQELKPLAEAGDARAQNQLSAIYANGLGVEQDLRVAFAWAMKAAKQGNAQAQNNIGLVYDKGLMSAEGIAKDPKAAIPWYRKAAQQGFVDALLNLGMLYGKGQGVKANPATAYLLFEIAQREGAKNVSQLQQGFAEQMQPAQIAKAKQKAKAWQLNTKLPL